MEEALDLSFDRLLMMMMMRIMPVTESLGYNSTIICLFVLAYFTAKWQTRYDDVMVVGKGAS